ncbi:hypothetical protein BJ973_003430 [Actinoplanes tereljensis]|uniref:Uncharacterized protein n=1 Tax=Paractinoplanes tereljensis TaxID=571912 RepID=A0A919NXQ3_9ACTN|nr:hypothetical protein [Actinoplanes tereljensis]GIF26160.1 hypothetical protein Ate02nite_88900 [Actinoplanes tereljensis]
MRITALAAALVLVVASAAPASAAAADGTYEYKLLAKAKPDECFNGIGVPYPAGPPCAEGQPKVNQAYVWGLTRVGTDIWFGTGTNNNCLTTGATLGATKPVLNADYVCEYAESQMVKNDPKIPPEIGDVRPPEVWVYDSRSQRNTDLSAQIDKRSTDDKYRRDHTIGLRAAGNFKDVVLLAGPTAEGYVNVFAFDARSHRYLGSTTYTGYGNVRTFLQYDNALYLGVGVGVNGGDGGAVLRWTGSLKSPFSFDVVASLPVQAADLSAYDGRIAATSWPAEGSVNAPEKMAGVWISPLLADGLPGLTTEDAAGWKQVWNARQYEPDKVTAATYGMGGVASYGGYLWWGSMHVPMKATKVHQKVYPQDTDEAKQAQVKGTQRATSIFRGKNLGTPDQKIELVYGAVALPVYDGVTKTWSNKTTNYTPLFGKSGFDNPYNNYTWRMVVTDGKLFVGTMDWSYVVQDIVSGGSQVAAPDPVGYGGDLWMFTDPEQKATAVNTTGMGNYLNYGIRNMIVDGTGGLYLGMANPMNLRTDLTDDVPEGGWELIHLTKSCK